MNYENIVLGAVAGFSWAFLGAVGNKSTDKNPDSEFESEDHSWLKFVKGPIIGAFIGGAAGVMNMKLNSATFEMLAGNQILMVGATDLTNRIIKIGWNSWKWLPK